MSYIGEITRNGIREWVQKAMQEKGFREYETEFSGGSEKGDGYMGDITFIRVRCRDDASDKQFDFVVKSGKDSKELRRQIPIRQAYENEIFFYKRVIPAFKMLQLDKHSKQAFNSFAEFVGEYTHQGIEILVLKNLKTEGFSLYDRKKPLNLDHLKLTFQEYGKYHALSLGLNEYNPELFNKLQLKMVNFFELHPNRKNLMRNIGKILQEAYEKLEEVPEIKGKFKDIEENVEYILTNPQETTDPQNVIIHGDSWSNNFMYKYNNDVRDKPEEVRFLDFQISRLGSPVCDLSYHIYACASKDELDHSDELLHIYHRNLSHFLKQFGYDPQKIFPFKALLDHWRKYSAYGLILSIFVLKFALCDAEEAPDVTQVSEKCSFDDLLMFELSDKSQYQQRVHDNIIHYFNSIK